MRIWRWIARLSFLLIVGYVAYTSLRRDIYEDPRPKDVVELIRATIVRDSSGPLAKVAGWIGQKKRLDEYYGQRNLLRRLMADFALEKLLDSGSQI